MLCTETFWRFWYAYFMTPVVLLMNKPYLTLTHRVHLRACSHLVTVTQIFDVVNMSSEMGCIVTNLTVRTWRQKKHFVVVKCKRTLTTELYPYSESHNWSLPLQSTQQLTLSLTVHPTTDPFPYSPPHNWTFPLQSASRLNLTRAVCLTTEPYPYSPPHNWTLPLQSSSQLNLTITVCLTTDPYSYSLPHNWPLPSQSFSQLNLTGAVLLTTEPYRCSQPQTLLLYASCLCR